MCIWSLPFQVFNVNLWSSEPNTCLFQYLLVLIIELQCIVLKSEHSLDICTLLKLVSFQFDNLQTTMVRSPLEKSSKNVSDHEIAIIRQFPFSSNRQCMSVIVRKSHLQEVQDHFTIFCKGSPEKITRISRCRILRSIQEDLSLYFDNL